MATRKTPKTPALRAVTPQPVAAAKPAARKPAASKAAAGKAAPATPAVKARRAPGKAVVAKPVAASKPRAATPAARPVKAGKGVAAPVQRKKAAAGKAAPAKPVVKPIKEAKLAKAVKPAAKPVKPVKAVKAAAKPVKPVKAVKAAAKPVKPVKAVKPAAKPVKRVKPAKALKAAKPVLVARKAKPAVKAVRPALSRKLAAELTALDVAQLQARIEAAFQARAELTAAQIKKEVAPLVNFVVDGLESGRFRVAEPKAEGGWQVNEWLKKAVLLYFRVNDMVVTDASPAPYWDKVEARFAGYDAARFREAGVRVVPGAVARRGTYFGRDVVLMPSFTNIGAHVGEGTMVDTWATVGSCAQIGKGVHLSGGAGIGGVLEPLQASPTIIEDHCFIGARSEVVEGVVVGHHSVIGMGVFLGQSTRIYNRATGEITYGYVPPYSVVVSGQLPSKDGTHSLYCAVIVKQVDEKTRSKTSVNDLLRGLAD